MIGKERNEKMDEMAGVNRSLMTRPLKSARPLPSPVTFFLLPV